MKCKNCKAEYKGNFCPNCGVSSDTNTPPPDKKPPSKGCGCLVLVVLILAVVLVVFTCGTDEKSTKNVEKDAYGWTEEDYSIFMVITQQISDEYVANYSAPWSYNDWTFAKFDDTGKVCVLTKYSFKNIPEKQDVVCVFTVSGENFSDHYLSIGNTEYLNDGSCDAVFDKINGLTE